MIEQPELRLATPGDMDAVFRIRVAVTENRLSMAELAERGITPAWMSRLMDEGAIQVWCAVSQQQVVGFSAVKIHAREVFALFVASEQEGRGIGGQLLQLAIADLARRGRKPIRLATGEGTRAHGFYLRRGWREVGRDPERGDILLELDLGAELPGLIRC